MTNGDRIRQMSNEVLASHLENFDCSYPHCPCNLNICNDRGCFYAWLAWMNQEVEE